MKLEVKRQWFTDKSTCGELYIDDQFECFSLEPATNAPSHPAIPTGTYKMALLLSNRFQMVTPHVLDVPGRTEIEWHPGNDAGDTEGCLLVGDAHDHPDWVSNSRKAFKQLMTLLQTDPTNLEVTYLGGNPA